MIHIQLEKSDELLPGDRKAEHTLFVKIPLVRVLMLACLMLAFYTNYYSSVPVLS